MIKKATSSQNQKMEETMKRKTKKRPINKDGKKGQIKKQKIGEENKKEFVKQNQMKKKIKGFKKKLTKQNAIKSDEKIEEDIEDDNDNDNDTDGQHENMQLENEQNTFDEENGKEENSFIIDKGDNPNETKKFDHKLKKLRTKERKQKENKHYDLAVKAKTIWEEFRREDCSKEQKGKLLLQLIKLIKGNVKVLINAHDTVRVIEAIMKHGSEQHRTSIFNELKKDIVELSKSKYAKFFVLKMLEYGTKQQKEFIIESFYGNVKKLLRHSEAAQIVEKAYNDVANHKQRSLLLQEYYGNEFAALKDPNTCYLHQVLEKVNPIQRKSILSQFKEELVVLIEKTVIKHSMVHFLFRQFFKQANDKDKNEMAQLLKEKIPEILHTKDGSRVAMECIWNGNAKDRKVMLKLLKPHVAKIAVEENGHFVLLAVFDSVDDTVLIEKSIINELISPQNALNIANNQYGIKVFEYLLSPRDTKFFHPQYINVLTPGDNNPHSKKDKEIRKKELRNTASNNLLKLVETQVKDLVEQGSKSVLVLNILTMASDDVDKKPALRSLIKLLSDEGPYHEPKDGKMHIIENGHANYLIKKLLIHEKRQLQNGEKLIGLSELLVSMIPSETISSWYQCNRGAFLLLSLIEIGINQVNEILKSALNHLKKDIKEKNYKGAQMLVEKLEAL